MHGRYSFNSIEWQLAMTTTFLDGILLQVSLLLDLLDGLPEVLQTPGVGRFKERVFGYVIEIRLLRSALGCCRGEKACRSVNGNQAF